MVQWKVVPPNDFFDLGAIAERVAGFKARDNAAATGVLGHAVHIGEAGPGPDRHRGVLGVARSRRDTRRSPPL